MTRTPAEDTEVTRIETLFDGAHDAYKTSREKRYEAIAKTFIWLMEARGNSHYIEDVTAEAKAAGKKTGDKDDTTDILESDTWETYSLKEIFGFKNKQQRPQLSKYRTVFDNLKKNPAWLVNNTFTLPLEQDVVAHIYATGGIAKLALSSGSSPAAGDHNVGMTYYKNLAKKPIGIAQALSSVSAGDETDYVTMLCEIDGANIKILKEVGEVTLDAITAKGTAERIRLANIIPDEVAFWKDILSGYSKMSQKDAVITLLADGKTIVISNHYGATPVPSPVFEITSDLVWSTTNQKHELEIDQVRAANKLFQKREDQVIATTTNDPQKITWTVNGSSVDVELKPAKLYVDWTPTNINDFVKASVDLNKKGHDYTNILVSQLEALTTATVHPNLNSRDPAIAAAMFGGEKDVEVTGWSSFVVFECGNTKLTFPAWGTKAYEKEDMVSA
jgi:hypothetical protein